MCWMVSAGAEAGCGAARAWQLCGFGILPNKFLQRKGPCMYRAIACKSSVLYIRLPCLQALGPLQEHTTFRESLVCYTSPPGGVYVLGVLPGVSIIQFVGCRGRSGFALPGPGRPAQSTGLGCPDSQASRARHSHTGLCRSCKAAGYSGVTVRKFQRPVLRCPCSGSGSYCSSNAPLFLLVDVCRSLCACIKPWGRPFCKGGRAWAAVQRDAALMNGNRSGYSERCGISLHLVPWGAVLCRGVPWLASGFPRGLWTDGAAFRRAGPVMKLHHADSE